MATITTVLHSADLFAWHHSRQAIFSSKIPSSSSKLNTHKEKSIKDKQCDHVNIAADDSWKWRTRVSFFQGFLTKGKNVDRLKKELLDAIAPLDRGAEATPDDHERVDKIADKLEAVNQIKEPLKSNLLNGKWELMYTTSQSILQTKRPNFLRPNGKIYQGINIDTLRAQNMETWPFFTQVTANLVPLNARRVAVTFDFFRIAGLIPTDWKSHTWMKRIINYDNVDQGGVLTKYLCQFVRFL